MIIQLGLLNLFVRVLIYVKIILIIRETVSNFKIGQLMDLNNIKFTITESEDKLLHFFVEGTDSGNNTYSLSFITTIPVKELLNFKMNESINFINYIDIDDIVFEKSGIYSTNFDIKMNIRRYLDDRFLLNIFFDDDSNIIGKLELDFSME